MSSGTQVAPNTQTRSTTQTRIDNRRADVINQMGDRRKVALDVQKQQADSMARRDQFGAHLNERLGVKRSLSPNLADRTLQPTSFSSYGYRRPYLHASYYDRPDLISYRSHHLYSYYDSHHYLHHRVIWPSFYFTVGYPFGSHYYYGCVYPYYHRKYVFISLGGYWPYDYPYMRYYWYGYHPYVWYGYYPVATEVAGETNNYYTYNYYDSDGAVTTYQTPDPAQQPPAVRQAEPASQTLADTRFEEGVKSFESGDYSTAARRFADAMALSPDDMILPFAYAQALFADQQYSEAAGVIRQALKKLPPDKESVFYPRGLYANDDVLFKQIEVLLNKQDASGDNPDLQLLLGYHLLGTGETGYAREVLEQAGQADKNTESVAVLLRLLEKVEKEAGPADKAGAGAQLAPGAKTQESPTTVVEPATAAPAPSTPDASSLKNTPDTPKVPDAETPDALKKDSAVQLNAGATPTPQAAEQPPANKEDSNEP